MITIEQGNNRPFVLVIYTDDILVGDHDLFYLPALHVNREKFLNFVLVVLEDAVLENVDCLKDIVCAEKPFTWGSLKNGALSPADALDFVEVDVCFVAKINFENTVSSSYYQVFIIELDSVSYGSLTVSSREKSRMTMIGLLLFFAR